MEFESFLVSLGTSAVIFVVLMFLFTWLSRRPGNIPVYYPNRILKGMDPWEGSSLTRNPFAWIREAFTSTEQDVVKLSGVDTAVYFVFLSTVLGIFSLSALILLPTLLPLSATDNSLKNSRNATDTTSNGTFSQLDNLSMANITRKSSRLWAFLGAVYWISVVTYFMLWKAYKHVASLRAEALMSSEEVLPEQFAILVRDIPSPPNGETQKEFVDSYFRDIYPETFYRSLVVTENSKINKIWEDLEGYKKKLARAEAVFAATSNRPTNKTGMLGLVGEQVDSIEYYTKLINESVTKLEAEQRTVLAEKQQTAAVVFFTDRVTAALAAQSLHCQMVDKWTVTEAPEPRQLIWENLKIKFFSRIVRQYLIYFIVAITILFYMIPIAFVSAITTLENLQKTLPFLKPIVEIGFIKTILESYLPQIALIVFLAMLPKFLMFLSKSEGIPSQSHAVRATSGKYFYFSVLNVFIGVTLAGSLFQNLKALEKKPNSIITVLATSLPKNATFFLTYVALKFFVGYGLELSRIIPLIIFHLKKKYLCKTEAEVKEAWYPGDLSYATRVPSDMLILTITFCYSVIAPLILVFGVIYFGLGWLILRNQALKVYVPAYESYGRMWPHIHTRILAALFLFQLVMFGYLGVKLFVWATLLVPLIFISLLFGYVCRQKFYKGFEHTALEVACRELKTRPDLEEVFKAYIPHSLSTHKGDDHKFKGAMSRYQDYAAISAA
ncbi:CSC1-like protein ERD4 [Raphanus sativus]|uniref:CSC1-like protein ERD4 n=1 Tax=Raphanus sativus TaxID=3726 RepID=A0A6J0KSZ8_RAPSA|nr:CSC1-like protein ERD4 [Raphanus sativus]XP_056848148.1 CSC1-like protein ERD4 [Raphanus sativus]KAJ4869945.1 CSC1-like protein ERD4 [Raphanus sativus]KAJ4879996.1 CSC1-like protein ERD4 [Raphanus sativus]